ncbi:DUF4214 domain-containing protein [Massilia timonae]|uniref:DUF4214 domain-containing protein n=1 Tax=Massilia timonae TaxID=47229 RepID=UPI0028D564CD|nr:DUF4214 domain-containing protein [Massilia timonae]
MAIVASQVAAVQQLYVSYFGRPADPAGLDYWTNIVEAQKSTAAVSATFAASAEYKAAYEGKTNAQIVDQLYTNLFGRPADATGRAYWVDLLDKGTIKVDTIVYEVSLAALTTDKEAVENKVAAATAFTAALDTEAEIAGYSGDAALVLAKAFITGVTTDATLATATAPAALAATVAAVVASGTDFTLEGAMASYSAAVEAKNAVLLDLADDEAVAAQLEASGISNPKPADVTNAIKAITTAATTGADGIDSIITGFSTKTAAQQSAEISLAQANNAKTLSTQTTTLTTRTTAVEGVANLEAAYETYTAAVEAREAAETAFNLTVTAQTAAVANVGTLNGGTFAANSTGGYSFTATSTGTVTPLIRLNTAGDAFVLETGVTEARFEGVTAALTAINARFNAQEARNDARTAEWNATIAADILDSAGGSDANLKAVAETFVFTDLGTAVPTYDQILTEREFFKNQIEALDARVVGGNYSAAITTLASDVAGIMAGATPTAEALDTRLDQAVTARVLTQAQADAIQAKFAATEAGEIAVNDALSAINYAEQSADFEGAVKTLLDAEIGVYDELTGTYSGGDLNIGTLVNAVLTAQGDVDATNAKIEKLADAVAAFNDAKALNDTVAAADKAIAAAVKVFTTEGYVAPVTLSSAITLATAKDDLFLAGSSDVSLRNFGAQGDDVLYVGKGLTYNDTEIGAGTGQTAIGAAGDDSVLEFFLQQSGNNVIVHVESKAFGSTSGTDITKITLVGVDLDDLVIDNGFITV